MDKTWTVCKSKQSHVVTGFRKALSRDWHFLKIELHDTLVRHVQYEVWKDAVAGGRGEGDVKLQWMPWDAGRAAQWGGEVDQLHCGTISGGA